MKISPNQKWIFLYLGILFVMNLLQSIFMELSYDEAYYWVYSQNLSWGYYDHPPMVAWLIKIGSMIFNAELGVRILFNIMTVTGLYILWKLCDEANAIHFILLTLAMPLIQAAGFIALPDTALFFFAIIFFFCVRKYLEEDRKQYILIIPLIISLLFYSKYHGMAVVLLTTFAVPQIMKRKSFWLIVLLTIIFYTPHLYWQYSNDLITFKFHLFKRSQKLFEFKNIIHSILSQVMILGLGSFVLLVLLVKRFKNLTNWQRILYFNTYGLLILLFFASFRNTIEANWSVTACIASIPLMLAFIKSDMSSTKTIWALNSITIVLMLIMRFVLMLPENKLELSKMGRLNEVKGWKQRIQQINSIAQNNEIIADSYQIAAKLSFYLQRHVHALHLNSRESQYSLLKYKLVNIQKDKKLLYISNKYEFDSIKIETGYKDPIFLKEVSLKELALEYGVDYEEIIRN